MWDGSANADADAGDEAWGWRWDEAGEGWRRGALLEWETRNARESWETGDRGRGLPAEWHFLVDEAVHFVLEFLFFLDLARVPVPAAVPGALGLGGRLADVVAVVEGVGLAGAGARPEARDAVVGARG